MQYIFDRVFHPDGKSMIFIGIVLRLGMSLQDAAIRIEGSYQPVILNGAIYNSVQKKACNKKFLFSYPRKGFHF
jgi:hypothetical protein